MDEINVSLESTFKHFTFQKLREDVVNLHICICVMGYHDYPRIGL